MSNNLCQKCFFYGEPLCSYQYNTKRDVDICKYFKEIPQTVFDQITASKEVLAEKFVYKLRCMGVNRSSYICWKLTIIYDADFSTRDEAIDATLERLKEVAE